MTLVIAVDVKTEDARARAACKREAASDNNSVSADPLEASRRLIAQDPKRSLDPEVACFRKKEIVGAPIGKAYVGNASARVKDELVVEPPAPAFEDHVDAGPELAVAKLAVSAKAGMPVRAIGSLDVVDGAGRRGSPL